jgi:hypothetical protein
VSFLGCTLLVSLFGGVTGPVGAPGGLIGGMSAITSYFESKICVRRWLSNLILQTKTGDVGNRRFNAKVLWQLGCGCR